MFLLNFVKTFYYAQDVDSIFYYFKNAFIVFIVFNVLHIYTLFITCFLRKNFSTQIGKKSRQYEV